MTPLSPQAAALAAPWRLEWGARPLPGDRTQFRVWAPRAERLAVEILGDVPRVEPLRRDEAGAFSAELEGVPAGSDYYYVREDGRRLPDPVSRWQPEGVHGPSRVVDPDAYLWQDGEWRGLPLEALVFYELHVGTFTPQGTFAAIVPRLAELRELGVTAVELMPVSAFPGTRNWGYDGAHPYAPQASYGGPEGLKALVDACHRTGLAVVLDVVYNHLGPEGNYLEAFGPYFSGRYGTLWGKALNFDAADCDPVRRYFIDNALYWLTEYHVDALRLDAIHGIFDFGARHVLEELGAAFHRQAQRLGRLAWVVAESDLNDVRVIAPPEVGGWGLDAQWSDDFHHAVHTLLTDSRAGYLADFGRLEHLGKALEAGFVYDGRYSPYRRRRHGNAAAARPARQFVVCTQNHDQVANASGGLRHSALCSPAQQKLAALLLCCGPYLPLLFMGQEYGEPAPFLFFTDFGDPALARAVTEGRREEQSAFARPGAFADPQAPGTFARSRLDWALREREPHAGLLRYYRALLDLRRRHPSLSPGRHERCRARHSERERWLTLEREHGGGEGALLLCNFGPEPAEVPLPGEGDGWRLASWSGEEGFGEPVNAPRPPSDLGLDSVSAGRITLGGWNGALYLRNMRSDSR